MKYFFICLALLSGLAVGAECKTENSYTWFSIASIESVKNQAGVMGGMVSTKTVIGKPYVIFADFVDEKLKIVVRYNDVFLKIDEPELNGCELSELDGYAISVVKDELYLGVSF